MGSCDSHHEVLVVSMYILSTSLVVVLTSAYHADLLVPVSLSQSSNLS